MASSIRMLSVNVIKRFMLAATLLTMLCLSIPADGQKVWEKKPSQQWSNFEITKILIDSPWGKIEKDYDSSYPVNIRLLSALPIRQALVRQKQLRLNYDKLTTAEKAKFDSEVKDFLECPGCVKYYILTYRIVSNDLKVRLALKDLSLDELKPYVFLINDKGERRNLVHFIPPERRNEKALFFENAVFFFERVDEQGKPLLSIANKKFYFQVDEQSPKLKSLPVKKFTFGVPKLIQNGEIIF
jgi:hypothetical protein